MRIHSDVLIIGSGIAGLSLAIHLAKRNKDINIRIVTKGNKNECNSKYAQGGIAVVIDKEDSFEKHKEDTLKAGAYLNDPLVVSKVVNDAPQRIQEVIDWGASFDRDKNGSYNLAMEGGHSKNRILHHKDITGLEIMQTLIAKASTFPNITLLQYHFVIDLITNYHIKKGENCCYGAYVFDEKVSKIQTHTASRVCIATGGIGQVYKHTTNPKVATGDGIGIAYRAKVMISGMEFIQFHPTALYEPLQTPSFLITEAVRGFGAILKNEQGERFMHKYDGANELSPRDIVSRAIDMELKKSGSNCVYLDITDKNVNEFKKEFPNIYSKCMSIGIDVAKQMIPVVPAMHYLCGGIHVDINGQSSVKNLYACGECTNTGLHGANRLASNSLLEALVFSHNIAEDIISNFSDIHVDPPLWNEQGISLPKEKILIKQNKEEIQNLMSNYMAIVRSNERLAKASKRLDIIYRETEDFYRKSKISTELGELRNIITVAFIIVEQSIRRRENKGTFYNQDLEI